MVEENDAWIERLEKKSQESWVQMAEMMELIRTPIKDKGQASGLAHKMKQPNLTKEGKSLYTRQGLLPHTL